MKGSNVAKKNRDADRAVSEIRSADGRLGEPSLPRSAGPSHLNDGGTRIDTDPRAIRSFSRLEARHGPRRPCAVVGRSHRSLLFRVSTVHGFRLSIRVHLCPSVVSFCLVPAERRLASHSGVPSPWRLFRVNPPWPLTPVLLFLKALLPEHRRPWCRTRLSLYCCYSSSGADARR